MINLYKYNIFNTHKNMSISDIPPELTHKILSSLNYETIANYCSANPNTYHMCDSVFWKQKLDHDFTIQYKNIWLIPSNYVILYSSGYESWNLIYKRWEAKHSMDFTVYAITSDIPKFLEIDVQNVLYHDIDILLFQLAQGLYTEVPRLIKRIFYTAFKYNNLNILNAVFDMIHILNTGAGIILAMSFAIEFSNINVIEWGINNLHFDVPELANIALLYIRIDVLDFIYENYNILPNNITNNANADVSLWLAKHGIYPN